MAHLRQPQLSAEPAYKALQDYYTQHGSAINMRSMFNTDPDRFNKFSQCINTGDGGDLLVDYSKNLIDEKIMELLLDLARARKVEDMRDAMFSGEKINNTDKHAVLHVALRNRKDCIMVDGQNVTPKVNAVLDHMKSFTEEVCTGAWKGYTGKSITDVVHIGIGGSELGSHMVTEALKDYAGHLKVHFVSNIDGTHLVHTLKLLNPETVLFIIASKSFTTQETITNATSAKDWFMLHAKDLAAVRNHFVAVSTNTPLVKAFGIDVRNMFEVWDWVEGPYALWSAVGLVIALYVGFDNFEKLLAGAHFMDKHFKNTPLEKNVPVLLAVISIWYINMFGADSYAVLPYDQCLHRCIAFFQQINMRSNGKSVTRSGERVDYATAPITWGQAGSDAMHIFYQFLHQGTNLFPCDFMVPVETHNPVRNGVHQKLLQANFLAQAEALMLGRSVQDVTADLEKAGKAAEVIRHLSPHMACDGNQPSNAIIYQKLTPYTLGVLIAMYEHKIHVQGTIWDINSYDHFGENNKLSAAFEHHLDGPDMVSTLDSSTNNLTNFIKSHSKMLSD